MMPCSIQRLTLRLSLSLYLPRRSTHASLKGNKACLAILGLLIAEAALRLLEALSWLLWRWLLSREALRPWLLLRLLLLPLIRIKHVIEHFGFRHVLVAVVDLFLH
jgi:hypothetical protein